LQFKLFNLISLSIEKHHINCNTHHKKEKKKTFNKAFSNPPPKLPHESHLGNMLPKHNIMATIVTKEEKDFALID
jgi:hypothetical protein